MQPLLTITIVWSIIMRDMHYNKPLQDFDVPMPMFDHLAQHVCISDFPV